LPEVSKRLAQRGFAFVPNSAADELNAWLRKSIEDKQGKGKKKGVPEAAAGGPVASDKKYIVNAVRGMNSKVVGQVTLPAKATDKEIKDAAVALIIKEGELKAGQDHKGVTFMKNIINVKC